MARQSQEVKILRMVWRKAWDTGQVRIPCNNSREADRIRFALYNAVRPIKDGKLIDQDLKNAVEGCKIRYESKETLLIVRTTMTSELASVAKGLGMDLESWLKDEEAAEEGGGATVEVRTVEEAEAEESAMRMQRVVEEMQDKGGDKPRITPYYSRKED